MQVHLADTSEELIQLVEAVLKGEEVVILKDDQPIAKLTSINSIKRRPAKAGSAKGLVWMSDNFDGPLEDFKEYME